MSKYRTNTHDAPIRTPAAPKEKPGTLPAHRIAVVDEQGNRRGHVGRLASEALVNSHFGVRNARLKKINGKHVWAGESGAFNQRRAAIKLQQQRTIAKGSVTKSPTKPALAIRPERGG